MEKIDLYNYSYFELEPGSRTEFFINGQSRQIARYNFSCHVYVIAIPEELDSTDLPF